MKATDSEIRGWHERAKRAKSMLAPYGNHLGVIFVDDGEDVSLKLTLDIPSMLDLVEMMVAYRAARPEPELEEVVN